MSNLYVDKLCCSECGKQIGHIMLPEYLRKQNSAKELSIKMIGYGTDIFKFMCFECIEAGKNE